ncbi:hypothetical protein LJ737_09425 [Hymenobacter sp. 15J16-1T3B]|uniref:hypothetical protein n=1 Tax=Hymenobacter sp. 15J16-1T3B TaxID=2886941 RepID=UPI001D11E7B3|nr:hypothetical protein [Hymenobacter sp. 15J16-1T3B]MCC3157459.1 hypothetical protein [Hymenobacter sp. 15J16-1T3B]
MMPFTLPPAPTPPLPAWAEARWQAAGLGRTYSRKAYLQPATQQADFDGDGKTDVAVLVVDRRQRRGIVVLHQGAAAPAVLGAGHRFGNGGDNFDWLTEWKLYKATSAEATVTTAGGDVAGTRPVRLRRPGLLILATDEQYSGGLVYWDGRRYTWLQQGD